MKPFSMMSIVQFIVSLIILLLVFCPPQAVGRELKKNIRQTIYVPVYSNIIIRKRAILKHKEANVHFNLSVNVSVHNTDPHTSITLTRGDYYDTEGNMLKQFVTEPIVVKPMASTFFFVEQRDTKGGPGANFIISWHADRLVNEPIVEGVTFGASGNHTASFISEGRPIPE